MARSAAVISASFANTALSPPSSSPAAAAFASLARSRIAARSSAENPFEVLPGAVLFAVFCVLFFIDFFAAIGVHLTSGGDAERETTGNIAHTNFNRQPRPL